MKEEEAKIPIIEFILDFFAGFYQPKYNPRAKCIDNWRTWNNSEWEQRVWRVNGWKWVHSPFWYHRKGDGENGARCAECEKWIERKTPDTLQVHGFGHYD